MSKVIKIVIADDHPLVIDGIKNLLNELHEVRLVGIAANGDELMQQVEETQPDIVIADINMPLKDGITCTRLIKKKFPQIRVLILTMYNDRSFLKALIEAGADGCLLKSHQPEELKEAIVRVMENRNYFDQATFFEEKQTNSNPSKTDRLSDREIQIIRYVLQDKTSREIAQLLFLSEHTVNTHRKNIYRKLGVNSQAELASAVLNANIL